MGGSSRRGVVRVSLNRGNWAQPLPTPPDHRTKARIKIPPRGVSPRVADIRRVRPNSAWRRSHPAEQFSSHSGSIITASPMNQTFRSRARQPESGPRRPRASRFGPRRWGSCLFLPAARKRGRQPARSGRRVESPSRFASADCRFTRNTFPVRRPGRPRRNPSGVTRRFLPSRASTSRGRRATPG